MGISSLNHRSAVQKDCTAYQVAFRPNFLIHVYASWPADHHLKKIIGSVWIFVC